MLFFRNGLNIARLVHLSDGYALFREAINLKTPSQLRAALATKHNEQYAQTAILPNELWVKTFSFFNKNELAKLSSVSKHFNALVHSHHLIDKADWPTLDYMQIQAEKSRALIDGVSTIKCLAVLPNGQIVSGSTDKSLRIWDNNKPRRLSGHRHGIYVLMILTNGDIVSGSEDNDIRVWDSQSGICKAVLTGHTGIIHTLGQSSKGDILSGSFDCTIRIWDKDSYQCKHIIPNNTYFSPFIALKDGDICIANNDTLHIYDSETLNCKQILSGHSERINCLLELPNGKMLSGSDDTNLRIWNKKTGVCEKIMVHHTGYISALALLPNNDFISSSSDRTICIWDHKTLQSKQTLLQNNRAEAIAVLPNGYIVSSDRRRIRIWSFAALTEDLTMQHASYR